jgi:ribosomal protein L7/L12
MANKAVKVEDVKEKTWIESVGSSIWGIGIMVASGIVIFFGTHFLPQKYIHTFKGIAVVGVILGAAIVAVAMFQAQHVDAKPKTPFKCPFCEGVNYFFGTPNTDFDCEHCARTVHFEDGRMVMVRTIICQACRTEHRVPMNIQRYVCDRCNRPLKLSTDITQKVAAASNAQNEAMQHMYDVLLVSYDRRHETATAMKIQNIMTVNLVDARKILASASETAPIPIAWGEPLRKAEALRRQFEELGATVSVKPSDAGTPVGTSHA